MPRGRQFFGDAVVHGLLNVGINRPSSPRRSRGMDTALPGTTGQPKPPKKRRRGPTPIYPVPPEGVPIVSRAEVMSVLGIGWSRLPLATWTTSARWRWWRRFEGGWG